MELINTILKDLKQNLNNQYNSIVKNDYDSICYNIEVFKKVKRDKRFNININIPGNDIKSGIYWRGSASDINDDHLLLSDHPLSIVYALRYISKSHKNARIMLHKKSGITFLWTYKFTYSTSITGYVGLDDLPSNDIKLSDRVIIYPSFIQEQLKDIYNTSDIRFIIFPILLYSDYRNDNKINKNLCILIYDKNNKELLRFTPLSDKDREQYQLEQFDRHFKRELSNMGIAIEKYKNIYDYIKYANNNTLKIFNTLYEKYSWNQSYYWCIWFFDFVTSNPDIDMTLIIAEMLLFLGNLNKKEQTEKFISKYTNFLLKNLVNSHLLINKKSEDIGKILDMVTFIEKTDNDNIKYIENAIELKKILDNSRNDLQINADINENNDEIDKDKQKKRENEQNELLLTDDYIENSIYGGSNKSRKYRKKTLKSKKINKRFY